MAPLKSVAENANMTHRSAVFRAQVNFSARAASADKLLNSPIIGWYLADLCGCINFVKKDPWCIRD